MSTEKKQSFLQGAIILILGTMLVKIIGLFFKMPLTNIIGAAGMGYFNVAYGLFNTLYALSVAGLPVAVAKMVAENAGACRFKDVRRIHRLSTVSFFITGIVGALIMFFGAHPYVQFSKNEGAYYAVAVMSPAILFVCLTSAVRGYYEGLRNMYPTAVSQVIEALAKLVFGLWAAAAALEKGMAEFYLFGTVAGNKCANASEAHFAALPYAAAGAVAGMALSCVISAAYLWLRHRIVGDGITKAELAAAPPALSRRRLLKRLFTFAVPVCIGSLVLNITTLIDISSITSRISAALQASPATVFKMYGAAIPSAMPLAGVPNFLYGTYMMAVMVFNLVPAITTTFGVSALPVISAAWGAHNKAELTKNIESVLRITAIVAFPAGLGLVALAEPILLLLYPGEAQVLTITAPMLRALGIAVLFVSLATPVNSMLQAIGRVDIPVKLMLCGGAAKLVTNYIFVALPKVNIQAAPYGTLLCYMIIICCSVPVLCRSAGVRLNFVKTFFKPFFAAVLCGFTAWASYGLLHRVTGSTVSTLISILFSGLIYIILLFLVRVIQKKDVLMLPNGKNIAKTLEKKGLIG